MGLEVIILAIAALLLAALVFFLLLQAVRRVEDPTEDADCEIEADVETTVRIRKKAAQRAAAYDHEPAPNPFPLSAMAFLLLAVVIGVLVVLALRVDRPDDGRPERAAEVYCGAGRYAPTEAACPRLTRAEQLERLAERAATLSAAEAALLKIDALLVEDGAIGRTDDQLLLGFFERDIAEAPVEAALHFLLAESNADPNGGPYFEALKAGEALDEYDEETVAELFADIHVMNGERGLLRLAQYDLGLDATAIAKAFDLALPARVSALGSAREAAPAQAAFRRFHQASLCGVETGAAWRDAVRTRFEIGKADAAALIEEAEEEFRDLVDMIDNDTSGEIEDAQASAPLSAEAAAAYCNRTTVDANAAAYRALLRPLVPKRGGGAAGYAYRDRPESAEEDADSLDVFRAEDLVWELSEENDAEERRDFLTTYSRVKAAPVEYKDCWDGSGVPVTQECPPSIVEERTVEETRRDASPFADGDGDEIYADESDDRSLGPYANAEGPPQQETPPPPAELTEKVDRCLAARARGETPNCRLVNVLYGTSRVVNYGQPLESTNRFGAEPDTPFTTELSETLNLGEISVVVPDVTARQRNTLGRPWSLSVPGVLTIRGKLDPTKHFILYKYGPLSEAGFAQRISDKGARSAFVYVHGYNTPMKTAAMRAAQIAADIDYDGQPMIYSWPTLHSLEKADDPTQYQPSRRNAERSRRHFIEFLEMVRTKTDVEEIHIIAHSMGNYLILDALVDTYLSAVTPDRRDFFGELIMAAPDVEADDFVAAVTRLSALFDYQTLYVSEGDRAMGVSRRIVCEPRGTDQCGPRAGYTKTPPEIPFAVGAEHDTIDVTSLNVWFFDMTGHNYATGGQILNDIAFLIVDRVHDPQRRNRAGTERIGAPDLRYWYYYN